MYTMWHTSTVPGGIPQEDGDLLWKCEGFFFVCLWKINVFHLGFCEITT